MVFFFCIDLLCEAGHSNSSKLYTDCVGISLILHPASSPSPVINDSISVSLCFFHAKAWHGFMLTG